MPSTPTYVALAEITLASAVNTVTMPVPSGYKDIVLVTNLISAGTYASSLLRFNSDTGSNYNSVWEVDGPSSFGATNATNIGLFWSGWAVNGTIMNVTQIMDYSATDKQKSLLMRLNKYDSEGNAVGLAVHRWASTSAITSLTILSTGTYGNSFASGSTLMMYGIEA